MPFESEAQRRYMFVHEPEVAKKWMHKYGTPKDLPYHVAANEAVKRHKEKK